MKPERICETDRVLRLEWKAEGVKDDDSEDRDCDEILYAGWGEPGGIACIRQRFKLVLGVTLDSSLTMGPDLTLIQFNFIVKLARQNAANEQNIK